MKEYIKSLIRNNRWLYVFARKTQRLKQRCRKPICGNKNVIVNEGLMHNVKYDIIGNNNEIKVMKGSVLSNMMIYIRGNNHKLRIGENCRFKGGSVWFEDSFNEIRIGNNTSIESAHLAITENHKKISIGEDCMFSGDIELRTGDSHSIIDNDTKKSINPAQDIVIGNHVWVGAHSIILKGSHIGDNTVIGTGSIVTRDILSNCIAGGIPARVIKKNIDWTRERILNS